MRTVVESDYAEKVTRNISPDNLRDVLTAGRKIWPRLGKEPMQARGAWPTRTEVAKRLGVRLAEIPRRDAITLLGFYSPAGLLKSPRPFIFVNSAHHPLAAATAFCHEIGHHLDTVVRDEPDPRPSYFDWDYSSHLDDSAELTADALVSLAAYPKSLARRMFDTHTSQRLIGATSLTNSSLSAIRTHYSRNYEFPFSLFQRNSRNASYISGVIHYAKLRFALLLEFRI
ncbi:MAG TPA: hypothetical protein VEU51_07005 [Candidatus Acidoferrales bacterium]|nr:hypothetical protein [Candidatus Acidoferrales bacterium]